MGILYNRDPEILILSAVQWERAMGQPAEVPAVLLPALRLPMFQTAVPEFDSITFSMKTVNYEGTWVPFQDGFQLYLPSAWNTYELTEDQVNQGVLYLAGDTSGSETAPALSVVWANSDGAETINDLATAISQGGYQVDGLVSMNGIPCVSYRLEDGDWQCNHVFPPYEQGLCILRNCNSVFGKCGYDLFHSHIPQPGFVIENLKIQKNRVKLQLYFHTVSLVYDSYI